MAELTPGFVCDLFVLRRAYDDEQHGISRETDDHDITEADAALFDHYDEIAAAEEKGGWDYAERDQNNTRRGRRSRV